MGGAARLGEQDRVREQGANFEAPLERRRRVQGLVDQQGARHLRPVDPQRRVRLGRPVQARRVEPGVAPGLERSLLVGGPVVSGPLRPAERPLDIGALDGVVDREPVIVARSVIGVVQALDGLPVILVDEARERAAQLEPGLLVIARVQEDIHPLVGADHASGRVLEQARRFPVEELRHRLLRGAEVIDLVVFGDPREPDVDVPVEGDVLVEVGLVPDIARIDVAVHDQAAHV